MSDNPLLDRFLQENTAPTLADLRAFVSEALGDPGNFELFDPSTNEIIASNRTIVYSGLIDGVFAGNVAQDIAQRAPEPTRVIDDTKIGRFFKSFALDGALDGVITDAEAIDIPSEAAWSEASEKFAESAKGHVVTIIGDTAQLGGDFAKVELPALICHIPEGSMASS
ncbi:hypothetical protein ACSSV8_004012 [Roseovarius sp. MBR-79]|jgi:hypothetical protein